jgi:hypothetical protein
MATSGDHLKDTHIARTLAEFDTYVVEGDLTDDQYELVLHLQELHPNIPMPGNLNAYMVLAILRDQDQRGISIFQLREGSV